jgi:ABC-type transporter Mla MlaB component
VAWFGGKKRDEQQAKHVDATGKERRSRDEGARGDAERPEQGEKGVSRLSASQLHSDERRVLRQPRLREERRSEPAVEPMQAKPKEEHARKSMLRPPSRGFKEVGSRRETLAEAQERERQQFLAEREQREKAKIAGVDAAEAESSAEGCEAEAGESAAGEDDEDSREAEAAARAAPDRPPDKTQSEPEGRGRLSDSGDEDEDGPEAEIRQSRPNEEPALEGGPEAFARPETSEEDVLAESHDETQADGAAPAGADSERDREENRAESADFGRGQEKNDERGDLASEEDKSPAVAENRPTSEAKGFQDGGSTDEERAEMADPPLAAKPKAPEGEAGMDEEALAKTTAATQSLAPASPTGAKDAPQSADELGEPETEATSSHSERDDEEEEDMRARLLSGAAPGEIGSSEDEARQAAIDEAAIVFAAGEENAAAHRLQECLAKTPVHGSERVWWMLMDLRQAQGDQASFERLAQLFAQKFGVSPPTWRSPKRERANTVNAANVLMIDGAAKGQWITQRAREVFPAAREKGAATIDVARMDPERSDAESFAALRQVMSQLRKRKIPSLLMGAGPLSRWLIRRVEAARGRKAPDMADAEPWLLLLEIFQWQGAEQMAAFDELSLAFAMWFELSGPGWDPAGVMPKPAAREESAPEGVIEPESIINEVAISRMQEAIRAQVERAGAAEIDFSSVRRMDFGAAGAFLNFLSSFQNGARAITLSEPSELVIALLDVVGVSAYVSVKPRKR